MQPFKLKIDKKPVIGYVIGRLGKCKKRALDFISTEILIFVRRLYLFERDFGND